MKEIWKDIKGFEGIYQVSNLGRIKSLDYNHTKQEKILKIILDKNGYLIINLYKNSKPKTYKVHRLVAKAFIENKENKPQINHIDGNKTNNIVDNLEWTTAKENINHAWNTGLVQITDEIRKNMSNSRKGEKNYFYGKHHTSETKDKISKARKGMYKGSNNPFYGKTHSEESKKKMSESHKKYTRDKHPNAKKIICITTNETFNYIREAAEKYNIAPCTISKCCKGKQKYAGKHQLTKEKLVWKYLE